MNSRDPKKRYPCPEDKYHVVIVKREDMARSIWELCIWPLQPQQLLEVYKWNMSDTQFYTGHTSESLHGLALYQM